MSSAVGDLVAVLQMNTAPFSSAMSSATKQLIEFSGTATKRLGTIASGPFGMLESAVGKLLSPLSAVGRTIQEAIGQIFNLVNPVRLAERAFQALMYPLQWCMRQLEGAFDATRAIDAFNKVESASIRLQSVLRATGGAVGFSFEQLKALAGDRASGMEAMIPAVTSGKIVGPNFGDFFRLSKDLASVMGSDLTAASSTLTRALLNPEHGMRALVSAGIVLSESDKGAVKALISIGDAAGAQAIILEAVKNGVAGTAEEMRGTLGGQMRQFSHAVEEVSAAFGEALAPAMKEVLALFRSVADWVKSNKATMLEWGAMAADAFRQVTEPLREFVALLQTDTGAAFTQVQMMASRLWDRLGDGATYLGRLFTALGQTIAGVFPDVFNAIYAKWMEMLLKMKQSMADEVGDFIQGILDFGGRDIIGEKFAEWRGEGGNSGAAQEAKLFADQAQAAMSNIGMRLSRSGGNFAGLTTGLFEDSARTKALQQQVAPALDAVEAGREARRMAQAAATEMANSELTQRARQAREMAATVPGKEKKQREEMQGGTAVEVKGSQQAWETLLRNMNHGGDAQERAASGVERLVQLAERRGDDIDLIDF